MAGFEEFFTDHYDEVVRTLSLAVGDRHRAEDAAQEAFSLAYRKWPQVAGLDRPVGWVLVVGMNRLRRWFTRIDKRDLEHRRRTLALAPGGSTEAARDPAVGVVASASSRAALDELPPRQRATVVLRVLCDLSTREVAQALGCSTGTVKAALHQGLANLRVELADDESNHERDHENNHRSDHEEEGEVNRDAAR
jgi:RNA polymerase sigma factor (sigma-70 family)